MELMNKSNVRWIFTVTGSMAIPMNNIQGFALESQPRKVRVKVMSR
jgi:hypothetical protein